MIVSDILEVMESPNVPVKIPYGMLIKTIKFVSYLLIWYCICEISMNLRNDRQWNGALHCCVDSVVDRDI